jgi:hypothetical protein
MPDIGRDPMESFTEGALWWKHEKLHRRAMADFHSAAREIRASFEDIEDSWFAQARFLIAAKEKEKFEFMTECWVRAEQATDRWIADLERRNFSFQHEGFGEMWRQFNAASSMPIAI